MPLYDYECPFCGHVFEEMAAVSEEAIRCENCDGMAKRVYSMNWNARADAPWVADCTIAFDKGDTRPEVREYLANPSDRLALDRACKAAGIRHADDGELKRRLPNPVFSEQVREELVRRHKYRMGQQ